jgi:protein SCO1/2
VRAALPLLLVAAAARADVAPPPELEGVTVTEHLGRRLPLDLDFIDAAQRPVRLGSLFGDGKPVVLVLAYFECPMLCGLVLRGTAETLRVLDWRLGREYRAVTVSFDPRDGWQDAGRKQANALAAAGAPSDDGGSWPFLTDSAGSARALADALGFGYRWDGKTQQFAHPAVIFVLTPDGRISRYLYGVEYAPRQLKLALLEASAGRTGSFLDRVIMACYHWDPATRRYGVFVAGFLRVGAGLVLATLTALIVYLVRLERRRARA